jgi:hypothetical protein
LVGIKAREAQDVKRNIRQSEANKTLQKEDLASELKLFQTRKESLEKSREQKQFFETLVPMLGISSFISPFMVVMLLTRILQFRLFLELPTSLGCTQALQALRALLLQHRRRSLRV